MTTKTKSKAKSIYDLFERDEDMETKGIWQNFGPYGKFLIARAGGANARFLSMLSKTMEPYQRQIQKNMLPEDVANELLINVFARTVILGWEGVIDKDGKAIEYSYEACVKLLTDLPDFFIDMREEATRIQNFRSAEFEDDAGN